MIKKTKISNKQVSEFCNGVYNIVRTVKQGQIMTYSEVARIIGNPNAVRAVGNALNKNYDPDISCHRVVRSDGKIGGYNRGRENKLALLKKEGIIKLKIWRIGFY